MAFQIALRHADHCASARLLGQPHGAEHLPLARIACTASAATAAAAATATAAACFRGGAAATATAGFRGGATATATAGATATAAAAACFRGGATATATAGATATAAAAACFRGGATATATAGATATAAAAATAAATSPCRASSIITKSSELAGLKPLCLALHPIGHASTDVLEHGVLRASVSGQHSARLPNRLQALRFGLAARLSFFRGSEVGNVAKHSTLQARWHVRSFWHQIISINTRGIHCTVALIQILLFSP